MTGLLMTVRVSDFELVADVDGTLGKYWFISDALRRGRCVTRHRDPASAHEIFCWRELPVLPAPLPMLTGGKP